MHAHLDHASKLALTRNPHGSVTGLLTDVTACAVDALICEHGGPAWDEEGFARLRRAVSGSLDDAVLEIVGLVEDVLTAAAEAERLLGSATSPALRVTRNDAGAHLRRLVHDGFVTATGRRRLPDVVRYVRGIALGLHKAAKDPDRDRMLLARMAEVQQAYVNLLHRLGPRAGDEAREIGWMIEELRVSLFAQQLGTARRVSEQRVLRAIDAAGGR